METIGNQPYIHHIFTIDQPFGASPMVEIPHILPCQKTGRTSPAHRGETQPWHQIVSQDDASASSQRWNGTLRRGEHVLFNQETGDLTNKNGDIYNGNMINVYN